ncbi:hypothetical protein [Amycolatopsis sp. SID8362]|uniref:hypothetical protein n=1 Tax=Amycolatopsis sp. SID8362 TaxID=2690346 RepID=UPI0013697038|nr:hypothetical protein [Amycolatopsis sp. SID8362]NBH04090.1 hypothetical protein [Amycolatopsis sp. SID8362]NED40790.1 hypothetical protein [Amycolatopsis sp. SID8362]
MNPLIRPQRVIGTGTLAVTGLLAATVLASGLSNTIESAAGPGVQRVAYTTTPGDDQGRLAKAKAKILGKILDLAAPLDPADPDYKKKLLQQVLANRIVGDVGTGDVSISQSDIRSLITDAFEIHRRAKQTVQGLQGRMSKLDEQIAGLQEKVRAAKTDKKRQAADAKLAEATKSRKELNKLLKKAEHQARPYNRDAHIRNLERTIWGLEQQVNGKLKKETKKKVNDRLEQARKDLKTVLEDRNREQRGDDEGGGTPAKRTDPKQPPKNPTTIAKNPTTAKGPQSNFALDKAFRGASQLRAGIGALQGVVPPYSYKELHDNPYLPTAYGFARALQEAPTEKDRQWVKDNILRYVLPDPHKRNTFLQALRDTYRPQIVRDDKGNYVEAVNSIRTEWEEHIARAFPVKVPTPRQRAIAKQEQLDREDNARGGPIKKPLTSRELALRKQEQIDREQAQRGSIRKPVYSRKDALRKQEDLDRADVQRGVVKPAAKKVPTSRQLSVRKQEQLDHADIQRGVVKPATRKAKVPTPRQLAVRKQEQLDRADVQRGVVKPAAKKVKVPTSRELSVRKQEQLDHADVQRGVTKAPAAQKTPITKKPTGKGGKNIPSAY